MIKDPDEQPDEEVHRVWSRRVPSARASVPVELEYVTLPEWMCSPVQKFSEPLALGFLWRFHYVDVTELNVGHW